MNEKTRTPQERVAAHEETVITSLKENGLEMVLMVAFPGHKKPPILGRLGVWLCNAYGGNIAIRYRVVNGSITSNRSKTRQ